MSTIHVKICFLLVLMLTLFCLLSGCTPAIKVPIEKLEYGTMDASENRSLLILLRGIGGDHHDFEALGVIAEIRRRDLPFDIVAPNAHYGYYKSRTLVERLYRDIIEPAQRRGYRRIWLAGFSMGGLGSLLYMRERPQDLDAVMLISPFLGRDDMIREITEAGGLGNWQAGPIEDHDWERLLWSWIKKYSESPAIYPQIYLGFGKQDQLVGDGSALLATVLNNEHVLTVDGRHDKKTMVKIFFNQLDVLTPKLSN